jgi:hypothetical protein
MNLRAIYGTLSLAANFTARLDEAVALTLKSASPSVLSAKASKVICDPFADGERRATGAAALMFASPSCEAVMVHEPAPVRWA